MNEFISNSNRDAWKSIRGFVQQVERTILRWINLPEGCILELERGEDIDQIAKQVSSVSTEERVLEQVKVSQSSITLRTKASVEALANLVEHRKKNPNTRLIMRVTTTSKRGTENPQVFDNQPAIDVWEGLTRLKTLSDFTLQQREDFAKLRAAVNALVKPKSLNKDTWKIFRKFIKNCDDSTFFDLLRAVEWSTGTEMPDESAKTVRQQLIKFGYAANDAEAQQLADRLFAKVFRLLTRAGLKQLRVDDLNKVMNEPSLSEADRKILVVLRQAFIALEGRVESVESQVKKLTREVALHEGIEATLVALVDLSLFDPPPQAQPVSQRPAAVNALRTLHGPRPWMHLYGPLGVGRRQLVLQVFGNRGVWLRCGDFSIGLAARAVESLCSQLVPNTPGPQRFQALTKALDSTPLVVILDLPRFREDDALGQKLFSLAGALKAVGGHLVTTGVQPLARTVIESHNLLVVSVPAPEFNEEEVEEWLKEVKAPPLWQSRAFARLVLLMGHSHGWLIAETIHYLQEQEWKFDEQQLRNMAAQHHLREANDSALARLTERLPEPTTRDLLYRLNLIGCRFDHDDVLAIAKVEPPIERPTEQFFALRSFCIDENTIIRKYRVSPLFAGLGESDVPEPTLRACHSVLADRIVRRRQLDAFDFLRAISHLSKAGENRRAAALLLVGLESATRSPHTPEMALMASVWADHTTPMPEDVEVHVRIMLRALQVVIRIRAGLEVQHLLAELDVLVSQPINAQISFAIVLCGLRFAIEFCQTDLDLVLRFLPAIYRHLSAAKLPGGIQFPVLEETPIEAMIFVNTAGITTLDQLDRFFTAAEAMTHASRLIAVAHPIASQAAYILPQLILAATESQGGVNWQAFRQRLLTAGERAKAIGLEIVAISCVAAATRVMIRHEDQYVDALVLIDEQLKNAVSTGPLVLGLVAGEALLMAGKRDDGIRLLELADKAPGFELPTQRMLVASLLSQAWAHDPQGKALTFAQRAVQIADIEPDGIDCKIQALGELAVAYYLAHDRREMIITLDKVGRCLREALCDETTQQFVSSWQYVVAFAGPPLWQNESNIGIPRLGPGAFFGPIARPQQFSVTECFHVGSVILAVHAGEAGLEHIADEWARYSASLAEHLQDVESLVRVHPILVSGQIQRREWAALILDARCVAHYSALSTRGLAAGLKTVDMVINASREQLSPTEFLHAEEHAAFHTVIPAIYSMVHAKITASNDIPVVVNELIKAIAATSEGEPWTTCISLLRYLIDQNVSDEMIKKEGVGNATTPSVTKVLANLVRGMLNHDDIRKCFNCFFSGFPAIDFAMKSQPILRRLIIPSFEAYWHHRLTSGRFQFSQPSLTEQEFNDLSDVKLPRKRLRRLLQALATSLQFQISAPLNEWLNDSPDL